MRNSFVRALLVSALLVGCGSSGKGFSIAGRVPRTSGTQSALVAPTAAAPAAARTVTHVMAVNPETAAPRRTLTKVASDGSFRLTVDAGRPYVLVFIDGTATGADMVLGIFRAATLDTITPVDVGGVELGDVEIDTSTHTATAGIAYDTLLTDLGLSPASAEYLGSIDDLSLRYANPDIDGDGVIDIEQHHQFALDFHVRSNMLRGPGGPHLTVADLTDQFFADAGDSVATPVFNMASIYTLYSATFDPTGYVSQSAPPTLLSGAAYSVTVADGSTPSPSTSYSALTFGETYAWGADYDYGAVAAVELPGALGSPATIAYTLGATGTRLTFTNVVTRTRASLTDSGTLSIFVRLNTVDGSVRSLDYRWMKRASAAWVAATAQEIAVTIGSNGGYIAFHRVPSWHNETGVAIPAQPSGTVAWTASPMSPDDICGMGVSYDDKLGLRHFEGGADPNPGVTCTP